MENTDTTPSGGDEKQPGDAEPAPSVNTAAGALVADREALTVVRDHLVDAVRRSADAAVLDQLASALRTLAMAGDVLDVRERALLGRA